jgi:hypothetical protein
MGSSTRDLQEFFVLHRQQNNAQIIELKIQNYFNMFITKHELLYTKQPISFSFLDKIDFFLWPWKR